MDYVDPDIKKPFQIEHIWSDKFDEHRDKFEQKEEFEHWRNMISALLLIPEGFNQSFSGDLYVVKMHHYYSQNLLARSLNTQCYQNNPSFSHYIIETKLPFKLHTNFKKQDISSIPAEIT